MSDTPQAQGHEALLDLIDMAQQEIAAALVEFSQDGAADLRRPPG